MQNKNASVETLIDRNNPQRWILHGGESGTGRGTGVAPKESARSVLLYEGFSMTPYYEDKSAGITIYHGDCRDVLPDLDDLVDAVIADPPYGIVNQFGFQHREGEGTRTLQFDWDHPTITLTVIHGMDAALAMVKPRGAAFAFCGGDQFGLLLEQIRRHGFTAKPAAWIKECPPPAGKGNWWPSGFELAVYGYRTGAWFGDEDPKRSNVFVSDSYRYGQPGKVDHPTQKPLGLVSKIVSSIVPPAGLCVDPFMGSGTTLVAAKLSGRRAIGIEVDEGYCETAAERLRQGVLPLAV